MADIGCYLCIAAPGSGAIVNTFTSALGDPLGSCFRCGVFACGHHALRNTSPVGWECVICVPSHIAPPPGPGGRPKNPPGGGPPRGSIQASMDDLPPYTLEEFENAFPTSTDLLRDQVRRALRAPAETVREYFGENVEQRLRDSFAMEGLEDARKASRIAAALAVINFADLPDRVLSPRLRRRAEELEVETF